MHPYRLSVPLRGWATIAWHPEHRPTPGVVRALDELSPIAGVTVGVGRVQVPHTVWMLRQWSVLLDQTGLTEEAERKLHTHEALPCAPAALEGLYPWQAEAVEQALGTGRGLLLADAMGLGKTRTAIAAVRAFLASRPSGARAPVLIIGPSFVEPVWRAELLATGAIAHGEELVSLRTRSLTSRSWVDGAAWIWCSYDLVHAWCSKIAIARPVAAIIDEAHWVKNPKAKRSVGTLTAAGRARFRMLLTGTPFDNRLGELWSLLQVLDGPQTWGPQVRFRQRYAGAVHSGFKGYEDRGPTHVEELRARMGAAYLRRTEEDLPVDALPELRRNQFLVALPPAYQAAQRTLLDGHDMAALVRAVLEGRAGQDTIALLTRLRQVTATAKFSATHEIMSNIAEQDEAAVLFCWERDTAERFARALPDADFIHGGRPKAEREEIIARFQLGMGPAILVATYGALREGVTLTYARNVVLHDLDWRFSTLMQAEKRIHRLGQGASCVSTWVLAEGSLDVVLARLLLRKARWLEEALGIEQASEVATEIDLAALVPDEAEQMADWAREQLARWVA